MAEYVTTKDLIELSVKSKVKATDKHHNFESFCINLLEHLGKLKSLYQGLHRFLGIKSLRML